LRTDLAGVFFRIRFERVANPLEFIQEPDDRSIATAPDQSVTSRSTISGSKGTT
jgi:hypothetical protein